MNRNRYDVLVLFEKNAFENVKKKHLQELLLNYFLSFEFFLQQIERLGERLTKKHINTVENFTLVFARRAFFENSISSGDLFSAFRHEYKIGSIRKANPK